MKRFWLLLAMVMVSLMVADGAWARVQSFVSQSGLNSNACSRVYPCRTFARAVKVTDDGGEVIVLNTAEYGPVTITKSISLIAPVGVYASVTPPLDADGITIDAAVDDVVLIKGLRIMGTGSWRGIEVNTVGKLIVDNCFMSELGTGIDFRAPDSDLVITDSKFSGNYYGVVVENSSGSVDVSMNNVEMANNDYGLQIAPFNTGSVSATVTNSLAYGNLTAGFSNSDTSSGTSVLNLEHCIASGNLWGIYSENNSSADITRLSNCTVTGNTNNGIFRWPNTPGTIATRGNNTVVGNGTNSNVTPTSFSAW